MGSLIYDFLNESLLFDESLLQSKFKGISEVRLAKELEDYREHVTEHLDDLRDEIGTDAATLRLFGSREHFSPERLRQTAFYLDQIVLPDPLFPMTRKSSDVAKTMKRYLGAPEESMINRHELSSVTRKMRELRPMIAVNYLKYYPTSYYSEPADPMPVNYSPDGYAHSLPSDVMKHYWDNVIVRSMRKSERGLIVDNDLRIGRGLAVGFKGDNTDLFQLYHYWQQEIIKFDDESQTVYFQMTLPEEDPGVDEWERWVKQSINQSALAHFSSMATDLRLCESLNANYITNSEFTAALLTQPESAKSIEAHTAECVLNLDLPFLTNVRSEDLMYVCESDGEAFALFRRELEKHLREVRHETDPVRIKAKAEDLVHELRDVQLTKIDQKVRELKKGALAESIIAIGGLAGTVLTSGASVGATLIAAAAGCHTYSEYREKVRENPAYFLWKVKNA